jgi:hypothetical protein
MMNFRSIATILLISAIALPSYSAIVKKTTSGFCHPEISKYYDRIDDYDAFLSLQECEKSGGRLPGRLKDKLHLITAEPVFEDSRFGPGWNLRSETDLEIQQDLMAGLSMIPVKYMSTAAGPVPRGRWVSPATLKIYTYPTELVLEHIVSLQWAWDHGASEWTKEKRVAFANNTRNLWAIEKDLHIEKDGKGPLEWTPPRSRCGYMSRFIRIVFAYDLTRSLEEIKDHSEFINRCNRLGME